MPLGAVRSFVFAFAVGGGCGFDVVTVGVEAGGNRSVVGVGGLEAGGFGRSVDVVDVAFHEEEAFADFVEVTAKDGLEAVNGFLEGDVAAGEAGGFFHDEEGLGEEALDFAGAGDGEAVFVVELVDA